MMRRIFCLLAIMAMQAFGHAEVTKLPTNDQKALAHFSHFREIHFGTNLPPAIFALCCDYKGRLAEPGQKWQVTDVIIDDKLPDKRLIWAVTDGTYFVVHYERGGIGHSFYVLVAKLEKGDSKPSLNWWGSGDQLKDYAEFLGALHRGKLDDRFSSSNSLYH